MPTPAAPFEVEVHVRVLGCLRPGFLTLELVPEPPDPNRGIRLLDGVPNLIALELVPFDLRRPNAEFLLVQTGWWQVSGVRRLPSATSPV